MTATDKIQEIAGFFLNLYRIQLGVESLDSALMSFNPFESGIGGAEQTFELKVNRNGKWHVRRMAIAPIGEGAESKSACYKAVYDDTIVVKIPPKPIKSFESYLDAVRAEQKIGRKLGPDIPCLSPNLSAIFSKIPHLAGPNEKEPIDAEEIWIEKARKSPGLQTHLKIGNTFVLFIGLSRYAFFGDILNKLHNKDGQVKGEIVKGMESTEDMEAFEARYGEGLDDLFFSLNDLIRRFEHSLSNLLNLNDIEENEVPSFKRREWFFQGLAEKPLEMDLTRFDPNFSEEVSNLLRRVFEAEKDVVHQYRAMIESFVGEKNFHRNVAIAKGVIINLLKLLCNLKRNGVALRDMKPENMFLIGESQDPENYLRNPKEYRIGLIDLETCANMEEGKKTAQPLLAGTPEYGTPTHLFENEVLESVYPDLNRILMLQDWYAAIGIVFRVIVARPLFEKTAQLFLEIIRVKHSAKSQEIPPQQVLKDTSWAFWTSAVEEFNENICGRASVLKSTCLCLNRTESRMLAEQVALEMEKTQNMLKNWIGEQSFFKNQQTKTDLLKSSVPALRTMANFALARENAKKTDCKTRLRLTRFFKELIGLKQRLVDQQRFLKLLYEKHDSISVYDLLAIMFMVAFYAMYDPTRTDRVHPEAIIGD